MNMFGRLLCLLGFHNWVEHGRGGWFICERENCRCMKFELNILENREQYNARKNRGIAFQRTV